MIHFFKNKKSEKTMLASADGRVIPMTEASDEVFSSCALGDGVVIRPAGNVIVAPGDGKINATMEGSYHAIGMTLDNGLEVLLHIGVNTVELQGEGFEQLVKMGQTVKAGQELIRFDRKTMEEKGYCMEIMQIVLENEISSAVRYTTGVEAKAGETVLGVWE